MIDYTFTTIAALDGKGGKVAAIETFNAVTGETIGFTIRRPYESRDNWIARAKGE